MSITFRVVKQGYAPPTSNREAVYLTPGDWDDYSFKTSFALVYFSPVSKRVELGTIKIGYGGQTEGWTRDKLPTDFDELSAEWFSLGQDVAYYRNLYDGVAEESRTQLLSGLRDVVHSSAVFESALHERVFENSLMRSVSLSVIHGQYQRVLRGLPLLTKFAFSYRDGGDDRFAPVELDFLVEPNSKPLTNVHVLIGRNGVGKTTLLNNMVRAIVRDEAAATDRGAFYRIGPFQEKEPLPADYFSSVVSVSFSAFDPFVPPPDRPDRGLGAKYFYVGMKRARHGLSELAPQPPKTEADLIADLVGSLRSCLALPEKRDRWRAAISRLESDTNFADMDLTSLLNLETSVALERAASLARRMSSGHAIVLLTLTNLVDSVEEKTLVLMDEPESHLHPPLLSAFTRALSDLLHDRNGVAIIATHSPVVVQEVPRSCVWKLTRQRAEGRSDRPTHETFGENVGTLTREIFGLEVSKSGVHDVLQKAVDDGGTFEGIFEEYKEQLGLEAQVILRTLIASRDALASPLQ